MDLPPTPPLSTISESLDKDRPSQHQSKSSNQHQDFYQALKSSIPTALSLPQSYLNKYNTFVTHNASSVSSFESALRSLTYLIPGRFRDAEMASESLHSGIQLLSLYHDSLLVRAVAKLPGMPAGASAKSGDSRLQRYTKYWTAKSKVYRRVALLLQCTRYTELLWEMAAKRRGEKVRWRVVVIIEMIKAICRLVLLRVTGGRMVVPPLPERDPIPEETIPDEEDSLSHDSLTQPIPSDEIDSAYASSSSDYEHPTLAEHKPNPRSNQWHMPRTGLTLPSLPPPSDISTYLLSKVLTADDIKPATYLLSSRGQSSAQIGEILHIVRPVIYAIAMARSASKNPGVYGTKGARLPWGPWLLGVAVELLARQLRAEKLNANEIGNVNAARETVLEKEEWNRRGWAMGWWAMRGAAYRNVTKGVVDGVVGSRWVPGIVGGIIEDYSYLWEEYHFASADS